MPIHDISLTLSGSLVVWPETPPVTLTALTHLDRGDVATVSQLATTVHAGTHVDAPCHFIPGGAGVDTLELARLIGPAHVVAVPGVAHVTAAVLAALALPAGTRRLLLRTDNSTRLAPDQAGQTFDENYVAVTADGADWLVANGIELIGIDAFSIAPFTAVVRTHQILLGAGVVIVEGLNLAAIPPGTYQFICLPLKIAGSDGAPARAVLIN